MCKHTNFTWILFLFLASTAPVYAEPCADFVFPTSDDFVLTEEENTTLLIPFTINHSTKTCLQGPFLIRFHKITDYSGLECSLTHKNGICQEPKMTKCLCPAETQKYYFNHTFRRDDNWPTEWLWSTDNDVIHQRNISFNVLCPSEIRLLELSKNETDTAYLKLGVRTHTDEIEDCKLEDASSQNQTPVTPMIFGSAVPTVSSSGTLFGESSVWVVASAVIGIIVLLNVIVCIVCALKAKRGPTPSPPTPDTTMRERQSIPLEEMASGQSVHYYWEVSDVSSAPTSFSEGEFDDELPPPPPPCHDPGHPPDDYLKPVSSRDEREDTGADWKMVPFYGNTQLRDIRDADRTATGTSNMSYTESGATENNKAVDESSDNLAQIGKCGTEAEETEYVRYSPPLYENTYP
ncbi:hypothetical protein BaRGS_00040245 [Batillaria attramentaria]|uniref:Uncharacterized protein n=1 Tax=Batillaria attramentaria TaxID=370345 RepID=A0ABD0J0T1_9CAEN